MSIKFKSEEDILNADFRKKLIQEITGQENIDRKGRELKKHEIYQDRTSKWIRQDLANEGYKEHTLHQMCNRIANVSICRKIVNKLAQTYTGGVIRKVEDEKSKEAVTAFEDLLDWNTRMRKTDRYLQLFRNTMIQIVPRPNTRESKAGLDKFEIVFKNLAPWEYDVIEDPFIPTKPKVIILTEFTERDRFEDSVLTDLERGGRGQRPARTQGKFSRGDNREQTIADSPEDEGKDKREFIWWSDNYHFTTDEAGAIISQPNPIGDNQAPNPIGMLPFVNIAQDQNCSFWAQGGEDVVDGSILINKILTDINFITFTQGWGQLVITGRDVPKFLKGGPDNAFIFEVKDGDPQPQVFFASSSPPISDWMETLKSTLAMMLSSNDLSPRNISAKLEANNAASGIAILIEQSESSADIQDRQQIFQDIEPHAWEVLRQWHKIFHERNALIAKQQDILPWEDSNVSLEFTRIAPVISEGEKLDNLKKRKELGLSTQVELIMKDNPNLDEEAAKEKAEEITKEKQARQEAFANSLPTPKPEEPEGEKEDEQDEETEEEETEEG